jgi:hypothetical protein
MHWNKVVAEDKPQKRNIKNHMRQVQACLKIYEHVKKLTNNEFPLTDAFLDAPKQESLFLHKFF